MVPLVYGMVEKDIYRCATIQQDQDQFQIFNGIKTVLILSPESPTKYLTNWIAENNIILVHLGLSQLLKARNSWRPVSEELIKEGLEVLLNVEMHPVLIMCTTGVQETGALVGCLRKLQDWNFNSIVVEYRMFAGSKSRYQLEQFIELFDTDLVVLPENLPEWYKIHLRLLEEEEEVDLEQENE
jgi:protein tyrosine/serine phosphatase